MEIHQFSSATEEILAGVRALEPEIQQAADAIEAERHLPEQLALALMRAGVFRMGVPVNLSKTPGNARGRAPEL
ncbi:MAG: hypothetical protein JO166_18360, partial [Deltaproteobacteria bacterium]|nr:hypothetical protein [Deltaproteobacteria bacterium]